MISSEKSDVPASFPSAPSGSGPGPWLSLLVLALAATAVVSPMFFLGNASGHDFEFHVASWMDVAQHWHHGVFYPRWAAGANFGFGEPRFIFYPPLSWMLGAALSFLLPWRAVPGAFIWLVLVLAGISMRHLARQWMPPATALACALFYALNPYHLLIVYYRSDFAELLASALFPLAVAHALRLGRGPRSNALLLALVFAAIWLSNAPAAVLISYSLALLITVSALVRKSLRALAEGATALLAGLGLAAFYIVPAAYEQTWVKISQVISPGLRPDQNFLFSHSNDPLFVLFNSKVSWLAVAVMLLTAVSLGCGARPRRDRPDRWWPLAVLAVIATLFMFPFTLPLWQLLPKLRFVQFPWRWLIELNLGACFLFAAATPGLRRYWRAASWATLALALAAGSAFTMRGAWWDSEDVPSLDAAMQSGRGYEGTDEYAPYFCDRYSLPAHAPLAAPAREASSAMHVEVLEWNPEFRRLHIKSERTADLILHLVNYPAWEAELDDVQVRIDSARKTGAALIRIPPGESNLVLHFTRTPDRMIGNSISIVFGALLLAFAFRAWKPATPFTSKAHTLANKTARPSELEFFFQVRGEAKKRNAGAE
jgi:hypothetical protein